MFVEIDSHFPGIGHDLHHIEKAIVTHPGPRRIDEADPLLNARIPPRPERIRPVHDLTRIDIAVATHENGIICLVRIRHGDGTPDGAGLLGSARSHEKKHERKKQDLFHESHILGVWMMRMTREMK